MNWVFDQLAMWIMDALGDFFQTISSQVLSLFAINRDIFDTYVPLFSDACTVIKGMAVGFSVVILCVALFRNMWGQYNDMFESPTRLILGFIMAIVLSLYADQVIQLEFNIFSDVYMRILGIEMEDGPFGAGIITSTLNDPTALDAVVLGSQLILPNAAAVAGVGSILLNIVFMLMVIFEWFKLLTEIVERYVVINLCFYFSPLAGSTMVSKGSSKIFWSYLKLTFSQLLLMCMNAFFARGAVSILNSASQAKNVFLYYLFLIAFLRAGQRVDGYMRSLGLDVAQTGGNLMDTVIGSIGGMGRTLCCAPRQMESLKGAFGSASNALGKGFHAMGSAFSGTRFGNMADRCGDFMTENPIAQEQAAKNGEQRRKSDRTMQDQTVENAIFGAEKGGRVAPDVASQIVNGNIRSEMADRGIHAFNGSDEGSQAIDYLHDLSPAMSEDGRPNEDSIFRQIPAIENAEVELGVGNATATLSNGAQINMKKHTPGTEIPKDGIAFSMGGETWVAKNANGAAVNTNEAVGIGETVSMEEAFGAQADAMKAATSAESVTHLGEGVWKTDAGKVCVANNYGIGGSTQGGKTVTGRNMLDAYTVFGNTTESGAISNGYGSMEQMDQVTKGSYSAALKGLGFRGVDDPVKETDYAVESVATTADNDRVAFQLANNDVLTCYDAAQYSPSENMSGQRVPVMQYGGKSYYVKRGVANRSNFESRTGTDTLPNGAKIDAPWQYSQDAPENSTDTLPNEGVAPDMDIAPDIGIAPDMDILQDMDTDGFEDIE